MTYRRVALFPLICIVLAAGSLSAAPITVHNTGVNASDVVQPIGSATSFWTLFSEPAGASEALGSTPFRYIAVGSYYADNALSGWVSPLASGNAGVGGNYVYQLAVDLTGFDLATVVISGTYGTDNSGSVAVNGGAPVATTGSGAFGGPTAFTINSGFVAGTNFIRVTVNNEGDPTAFRVQFSSATGNPASAVPEPGVFSLVGVGLIALSLYRRQARAARPRV